MSATPITLSDIAVVLRRMYNKPWDLIFQNRPLLGMIPKNKNWSGTPYRQPIIWGSGSGISATFANAQGNSGAHSNDAFDITNVNHYALVQLEGEMIDMGSGPNALLQPIQTAVETKYRGIANQLASALYRNGNGVAGQEDGTWTSPGTSVVLTDRADAINFYKGAVVVACATETGSVKSGTLTVSKVDRNTGTITFTEACDTGIATFAQDDYLFIQGNAYNNSAKVCISGLDAWLQTTAGTLFGVDCTTDTLLSGNYFDGSGYTNRQDVLIDAVGRCLAMEGMPTHIFMNPIQYGMFIRELSSKDSYERISVKARGWDGKDIAKIGYSGIRVLFSSVACNVFPDPFCPMGKGYALELESFKLVTKGQAPRFIEFPGTTKFLQGYNFDGIEIRQGYRGNAACAAPGHSCKFLLKTTDIT